MIDGPVGIRQEGDTMIVPILEEVLVVEKRLMLKEELRITTMRRTASEPQHFTLRSEEAIVERLEPNRPDANADPDEGNSKSRNKGA
jgi:stress response protein YsnF